MRSRRNIVPVGVGDSERSAMVAQVVAMMAEMPADYITAVLPVLAQYAPGHTRGPRPAMGGTVLKIHRPGR